MGFIAPKWLLTLETIHLIGASTLAGKSFYQLFSKKFKIISYSRKNKNNVFLDIDTLKTFSNIDYKLLNNSYIVSFAPIWVTAKFFSSLSKIRKFKMQNIKGLICCSSSSAVTKRFATNLKDKKLVETLLSAEHTIQKLCINHKINCIVIRPTLIYGKCGATKDNNLFKLLKIIKLLPFVILPKNVGLRQPIHAFQLAKLACFYLKKFSNFNSDKLIFERLEVGGDEILSYKDMLLRLLSTRKEGFFKNTKILTVPNIFFYIIISPMLFVRPKIFETIFRISSNFSGFPKCSELLGETLRKFPYIKY